MRTLRILPVGNGACSIVRQSRSYTQLYCSETVSIIDCGQGSRGGRHAAAYLEADLSGRDWDALQSLVITHWDADHWNGLRHFADNTSRTVPAQKRNITLYSPAIPLGVPARLPAGVLTLISATSASGVEAIDFVRAWRKHFEVDRVPVAQGDTIELAGRPFKVEWPPKKLTGTVANEAVAVLAEIEALADSNPRFGAALRDAYAQAGDGAFGPSEGGEDAELNGGSGLIVDSPGEEEDPFAADHRFDAEDESSGSPILNKAEHGPLIKRARRLQNLLSLVFHDPVGQSLVVYGDATKEVVRAVAPQLQDRYLVQLAPHHGTHPMPLNAPYSVFSIAQCSQRQKLRWLTYQRKTMFDLAICDFEPEGLQLPLDRWPGWY